MPKLFPPVLFFGNLQTDIEMTLSMEGANNTGIAYITPIGKRLDPLLSLLAVALSNTDGAGVMAQLLRELVETGTLSILMNAESRRFVIRWIVVSHPYEPERMSFEARVAEVNWVSR